MASASTNLLRNKYRSATPVTDTTTTNTSPTNRGGFANGIGYTVGKLGTGALSILEGIWDYTAGGIADLFGADAWAEQQFANNVTGDLNNRLDTWYNPSGGWQIVGDVASGVGNTLAGVGITALATVISGGTLTPYAAGITAGAMGLGAAGMGTSEAYAKTGELGLKEYGYGAITGATEGLLEKATGGASKIASRVFAKNTAKTLAKQTVRKGIIKNIASDFAGEFFEEAVSEFITPYYQRWTQVDPNAENATIQQIGYAGLVGGIAGALTGGTTNVIQEATRGGRIAKNAEYTKYVVDTARQFAEYEDRNKTGRKPYETIKSLLTQYESITNTGKPTAEQKKLLAKMDRQNVALTYEPEVQNSRNKIIAQADALAQRLNELGYKDENGKPYNFKNGADLLKNESLVMQLAVQDAMANVLTATETFDMATALNVGNITEQAFDRFKSEGMTQQKKALMELTGIDIDKISYADFITKMKAIDPQVIETAQKAMQMRITGKQAISNARQREERLKESIQSLTDETIKGIKDGNNVFRTANGQELAVIKEGDTYFVWDGKNISRPLSIEETVGALNEIKGVNLTTESGQNQTETPKTEQPTETQETTQENENKGQEQATEKESKTKQEKTEEKAEEETPKAESKEESKEGSKPKKPRKKPTPKKSKEQLEKERNYALAKDFVAKLRGQGGWYAKDVFNYVEEHPKLNFIERIFDKDDTAKQDLANFLDAIDDIETLEGLKHYMSGAYGDKGRTWERGKATYPYRGAVRTFQNAISRREQAIGTGTNLGIKNGIETFAEIESLFDKLNSNRELAQLAKRVFATAKKLGVNIRFVNQTFAKDQVAGDNVGDMVEYKTSYFNDTTVTDQHKASTLVHEMIHACTVYVMSDESVVGDPKLREIRRRFNEIYDEIKYDKDFSNEYGISNAREMVAELANEAFVFKMKKKTIWEKIVDAICELFGFKRGTSAYDNAMACLDYLLDNPDIKSYREYAQEQRRRLRAQGDAPFGELAKMTDTQVRDGIAKAHEISRNLAYKDQHKKDLEKNYNSEESTVALDTLIKRYNKILDIWERIGGELNSDFLNEWNSKVGKDRSFTVFKAQAGYKYNIELSTMCKKGVPLFEAIDTIVKKEVMKELGVKELGKAEKEILYDILKDHNFEIPCAICYVEQARQREGVIIDAFVNGKIEKDKNGNVTTFKLGWNEVLKSVQEEMKTNGVDYTFPAVDRKIATDGYAVKDITMDEATETAFYNALKKVANKEIARYNEERKDDKKFNPKKLIKDVTPAEIKEVFKGTLPSNLKIFKVLFQDPSSRFTIQSDLLYSSMTTLNLAKAHKALYSLFNQQGGVAGYKSKQTPIIYWGDILEKTYKPKDTRLAGGIRNQSNSDSQAYTLLDKVQMYVDLTAKGYYLQAYTKVLFDLKLFGLSNGKQNASLIPRVVIYHKENGEVDIEKTMDTAGLDENGNPIYDDIEGIPHEEAFMLIDDAEYSKTITGICIGYSDKHIFKLLDDKRVQLIIGYHDKSNDTTMRYRGAKYSKNYNNENEAIKVNEDGLRKAIHIGFNQFVQKAERMFKYNAETGESATKLLYHNGKMYKVDDIPNLASALYLEYCQEKGYTPAYDTFKNHPNYYKLLADFGLKDSKGHYAPHKKVAYNMPDKVPYLDSNGKKQYMDAEEYIKAELKKEMAVRDSISEALADDSKDGIIPQFKEAVKKHRAEISKAKTVDSKAEISNAIKGSDKVMTELPKDKISIQDVVTGKANGKELIDQEKASITEKGEASKVLMTNAQAGVERVLKEGGTENAEAKVNFVRAGRASALNAIDKDGGQYNLDGTKRLGASLGNILMPIYSANAIDGKTYADFELYLLHWHNTDRYRMGKPVFNELDDTDQITDKDSWEAIAELDKQYPMFRKIAEQVWKYNDNNLQIALEGGVYTQEYVDELREMYPHYVPTFREEYATKANAIQGKNNVRLNNAKKKAVGSSAKILPIDEMMATQTIQKITTARINNLLVTMLKNGKNADFQGISSEDANVDVDKDTEITFHADKDKNKYQITFYHEGKMVTARVSWSVYKGIESFQGNSELNDNLALNALAKANTLFKKMVTSWNPFFSFFRNPVRDIQDAMLYTKHSLWKFGKNYIMAFKEISKNGKYWQEAKSAGITSSSVYDINEGIDYKKQGITAEGKRIIQKTESLSNAIEMAPRLAEYISARESGLSIEEALLQAQDVTTNFGRGGTFAKTLNRTIAPFLNPSIQGFSKMWRSYFTKELGTKGWIALIIKSIVLGVGLTALNDLLNDDDEEYQNLSDYVKEQNYVLGDGHGNFLKLPKGRVASVFGGVFLRGKSSLQGNEDAWEGYFESVLSAVTPAEQITRNIFSPITDVQTNTAWHGGTIESAKWEDTAPKYRYDETTSKISIWLGDKLNYSPIKINYLIDQYTGVIGDVLLPMTSTQASSGLLEANILANSTTNSKWSTKYYDTIEKYTFKGTAGDLKAKGVVRYLNCVSNDLKKLREYKAKIQQSATKSDKEKLAEVKVIQTEINALMAKVLSNVDFAYNQFSKVDLTDEDAYNQMYRDIVAVTMGSEYAIKGYSTKVYEKAVKINDLGIDYDTYYDFYFGALGIEGDKDKNGETISGTKKKKLMQYIWSQDISTTQKLILLMYRGYSVADGEVRGMTARKAKMTVAKYISSLSVSKDYKKELAEMLGFTVKNGKILYN
jgi:hypothetical protein